MDSVWTDKTKLPGFEKLKGDIKTDVLIIGGGMAGILCAFFLREKGVDYTLVEAQRICSGVTANTTAKITAQHGLIYDALIQKAGIEKAKQYLTANQLAIERFKELAESFSCDWEERSAFVYSIDSKYKIEKEVEAINRLGVNAAYVSEVPLPIRVEGAVKLERQAQFNPLKLIDGMARSLNIYENTFVKKVEGNTAITRNGRITAQKIIIATHFPFINTHGSYFLKMYQHRSYVIALENAKKVDGMYVDEKENGMSFRDYGDLLFVGGGDHRTGKIGGGWEALRQFAKRTYPDAVERYAWATQDCMTLDDVPYIGRYSKATPDLYVATGFNKWGMTSSMVSAMVLSDMLTGRQTDWSDVFSPSRSMMKRQLLINGYEAAKNLLRFPAKRCSHLGCALQWNKLQHSWDCPCHGSRFDESGHVIDNPAMEGIKTE